MTKLNSYLKFLETIRGCGKTSKLVQAMLPRLEAGEEINIIIACNCEIDIFLYNKGLSKYKHLIHFITLDKFMGTLEDMKYKIKCTKIDCDKIYCEYNTFISHEVYEAIIYKFAKKLDFLKDSLKEEYEN